MIEKDLPGQNCAGWNTAALGALPLESCETINGSWGFDLTEQNLKSTRELVRYLVRAAGADANFLLNVGPMPSGAIQPEFVERLKAIGQWLQVNGESIYGTRRGPVAARPWGVTTQKGNTVYVHILDWLDDELWLPMTAKVRSARVLGSNAVIRVATGKDGVQLSGITDARHDNYDTIIALELAR